MKVKFYYFRTYAGSPVVTVAVTPWKDGLVARATAFCSVSDVAVKSKGREIAEKRLMEYIESGVTHIDRRPSKSLSHFRESMEDRLLVGNWEMICYLNGVGFIPTKFEKRLLKEKVLSKQKPKSNLPINGDEIMKRFGLPSGKTIGILKKVEKDAFESGKTVDEIWALMERELISATE